MNRAAYQVLVAFICLSALGCAAVSFLLMLGSGFIFAGDIDLTEMRRQSAGAKAYIFSIICFLSLCLSVVILFMSGRVARSITKALGIGGAA